MLCPELAEIKEAESPGEAGQRVLDRIPPSATMCLGVIKKLFNGDLMSEVNLHTCMS